MIFFPLHSIFFFSMHRMDDVNIFDMLNINKVQKGILNIVTFIIKYRHKKNMLYYNINTLTLQ